MPIHGPSHFFPKRSESYYALGLLYTGTFSAGMFLLGGLALATIGSVPLAIAASVILSFAAVGIEILILAAFRHYLIVRPHRREAAHRCPECDYHYGVDLIELGCPECGWQRQ